MEDTNVDYSVLRLILDGSKKPGELPLEILTSITDNFSEDRKIGRGGFSDVYKGVLDGWTVAVKKIRVNSYNIEREGKLFYREVECLLNIIEHRNVVRFLGFCSRIHHEVKESTRTEKKHVVEIRERLLCFEYISSGSLEKHITDELRGLEWDIRYKIINGICEGLSYLHNQMRIVHMDLKPANILVDTQDMVPKITDFGLAKLLENDNTTGDHFFSRGYCAPEYMKTGKPTFECDIYSLGNIIREIVTGRNDEMPIKDRVIRRWRCRWRKSYTALHVRQITKCVEIAERCTQEDPKRRPSISDIISDLDESANTNAAANQIPSWDYDDMMLYIEPLELRFAFDLNKEISKDVVLTNDTGKYIAFNIKTSSQQYCMQPNKGIVPPRSKNFVNITLTTLRSMTRADEFIVQSTKVERGFTDEEITEDIFNEESGTVVDEVNLTVIYDNVPEKPQADQSLEAKASVSKEAAGCSSSKDARLNYRPIETTSATNQYKANERAAVDIMTGAMGGLLPKLDLLLKEVHSLPEDVKENLESVKKQLTIKHIALCKVPHDEMHMLDLQDKEWANEAKKLSYDIDDMVDRFLIRRGRGRRAKVLDHFRCLVEKMLKQVSKLPERSELKLTTSVTNNRPVRSSDVDPRIMDLYKKHKYIGIDGPRDSLVKKLTGGDDASSKKLKIISIFGEGGLGKTTLAREVFDKLAVNFVLTAFVPVGRNPDIERVMEDILYELHKEGNKDIHNTKKGLWQLINLLRKLLENNRYFIIIDDIWDIDSWKIIKCALIDNDNGSRVMTTSRINGVTEGSGEGCKLEPLSYDQSKQLFYSRLTCKSTSTSDQPDEQYTEYILEKCGGLPLAIITIASLLDSIRVEEWPKVYNLIKFGHEDNKAENTKKILLYSYYDLPYHLKTCLLYLSIYPEDIVIDKRTLVWKWIAEGFVQQEKRKTLFEVGEGYFNELINRSLIQPAELSEDGLDHYRIETGSIGACRVHDMVLDLVRSMAKEENFVAILDTDEKHLSSLNNARILAVHKSVLVQRAMVNTCIKKVRSFNVDCCNVSRLGLDSLLPRFQFLRVLSFQGCGADYFGGGAYCLKSVAQLRHLRFLSLAGTFISELPMEIGHLRCLQILNLMETYILELPQSVTQLTELKSLLCSNIDCYLKLPVGMGSLTSLEELRLTLTLDDDDDILEIDEILTLDVDDDIMEIDNSSDEEQAFFAEKDKRPTALAGSLEELGNLTELRVLHIYTRGVSDSLNKALVESLNKLKKIEELVVCIFTPYRRDLYELSFHDTMWDDYSPCKVLRHLSLYSPDMPVWIDASLENIVYLELDLRTLTEPDQDLSRLGSLPQLRSLDLRLGWAHSLHGTVVADSAGAFPKLRHLQTECSLTFVPEAMQCLEYLSFMITMSHYPVEVNFDSLKCLHSLKKVSANFNIKHPMYYTVPWTLDDALRRAVNSHPNGPILDL